MTKDLKRASFVLLVAYFGPSQRLVTWVNTECSVNERMGDSALIPAEFSGLEFGRYSIICGSISAEQSQSVFYSHSMIVLT